MDTITKEERKSQIAQMENQLRLNGQKLDLLWNQARTASGRSRAEFHSQIQTLKAKMQADRSEQNELKKIEHSEN